MHKRIGLSSVDILNPSLEQRDRGWGKITLRRENPVGGSDTPVLGELNPPKNSKIPQRNHEIAKGGSWGTLTVVHEK
jgi:hypothetical protein